MATETTSKEAAKVPAKAAADQAERAAIAQLSAFFTKWEQRVTILDEILKEAKSLRHEVVTLLNARDMLDRRNKDAAIELERVEREARTRLSTIEQGHRTLVDDLSKKQIALDNLKAELDKREAATAAARHEAELIKHAYEQKLSALSAASPKAKGA